MRRNEANKDIRDRVAKCGMFLWQLARKCDVSPTTMTMWLREELPKEDSRRVLIEKVLDELERT